MSVGPVVQAHPAVVGVEALSALLAEVAALPVELLDARSAGAVLVGLARLGDQVASLRMRVLATADDVAAADGARDAGAWLAHRTRGDRGAHQRELRLARALADRWGRVGDGLADGRVNVAQARVIVDALDALPDDLPVELITSAEEHLLALAADFGPQQLRVLGRKVLDVLAPEVGEAHEARALADEERRAGEATVLTFHALGDGRTRLQADVPDAVALRLRTYLESFTSPRHDAVSGGAYDGLPVPRQRGEAFCFLLEAIDPQRMPLHGGDATTIVVTVTLDALRSDLAAAGVLGAGDERISAAEARRLACQAKVLPAVLGGRSEVLDLGRAARLFSPPQRKALRIRDRRCRAEGCTVPATWCEAHHRHPWSAGGRTDLADGVLLCGFHHRRIHDPAYRHSSMSDGDIRFYRRT